ncbi:MAG: hypothetical protein ACHP7J_04510 [Terriglobales bacterium]
MKRIFLMVVALLLSVSAASAATTQKWTAGWDDFGEPLNYSKSKIKWSVAPTTSKLTVTFTLVGATPSKLYQMSIHFFCTTFPPTFGQFPTETNNGACVTITRQGVTASVAAVELGVVTTDIHGNGTFNVVVGPVASGTYTIEFIARNGAGCGLVGGGPCDPDHAAADFQSPGPFGTTTTITVP